MMAGIKKAFDKVEKSVDKMMEKKEEPEPSTSKKDTSQKPSTNAASKVLSGLSNLISKKKEDTATGSGAFAGQGHVLGQIHEQGLSADVPKPAKVEGVQKNAPNVAANQDLSNIQLDWVRSNVYGTELT